MQFLALASSECGWELSMCGQKKTLSRMFFSTEIQGGLGPGVCCPKTIVQATSKMKNRFNKDTWIRPLLKRPATTRSMGGCNVYQAKRQSLLGPRA